MSVFEQIAQQDYVFETEHFFAIYDRFPVSPGHLLIISKAVKQDYFSLDEIEQKELTKAVKIGKVAIEKKHTPTGFNIGMNCGEDAGQTVMHFHCHIIPRYKGDMENPKGGIRHCVEGKGYY